MNVRFPVPTSRIFVNTGGALLKGELSVPAAAKGVILLAHASAGGRYNPRNRCVAEVLQQAGWATLLVDLLPEEEEAIDRRIGELRSDVKLLAARARSCAEWLKGDKRTRGLPIGYFGAGTGAAASFSEHRFGRMGERRLIAASAARGPRVSVRPRRRLGRWPR